MYIIVNVCKQLLISGGGQLLGNEDGVKILLGSALPVTSHFNVWFMIIRKLFLYFLVLIKTGKGLKAQYNDSLMI